MTEDQMQKLQVAWLKRKELWAKGSAKIIEGNKLWEEIKQLPGAARISIWYAFSEMSCEAADTVSKGYSLRLDADRIWHDAVAINCGPQTKVTWAYDDTAKGYDCTLETGEIFKA